MTAMRFFVVAALVSQAWDVRAQVIGWMGATQVIVQVKEALAIGVEKMQTPGLDDLRRIEAEAELLRSGWKKMAPEAAATQWLELLAGFEKGVASVRSGGLDGSFKTASEWRDTKETLWNSVLSALPGPATWDALRGLVEKLPDVTPEEQKRKFALTLFAQALNGDRGAFETTVKESARLFKGRMEDDWATRSAVDDLRKVATRLNLREPADVARAFQKSIAFLSDDEAAGELPLPDLVSLVGEDEARVILKELLAKPQVNVDISNSGQTGDLYKKMVVKNIGVLVRPLWELVTSPKDVELFEAMDRKFPKPQAPDDEGENALAVSGFMSTGPQGDDSRSRAAGICVMGLVEAGRLSDAVALTLRECDPASCFFILEEAAISNPGSLPKFADYCEAVLNQRPLFRVWTLYCRIAPHAGHGDEALRRLRASLADRALKDDLRVELEDHLFSLLLATDHVDEAVAFGLDLLRKGVRRPDPRSRRDNQIRVAQDIIGLGQLMNRPEWTSGGLGYVLAPRVAENGGSSVSMLQEPSVLSALRESGRWAEAEVLLCGQLEQQLRKKKNEEYGYDCDVVETLSTLAAVYDAAGRYGDVLVLLNDAPWWAREDLSSFRREKLGVIAARALAAQGRYSDASRVIRMALLKESADDDAYAVLIDVEGERCLPYLDFLVKRDRFEERPLIWKGEVLRRIGKLEEAEAAIRTALKVDPTDGEESEGDRVRAYSVLSEILKARGKADDATFFAKVVESVRTAEVGDRYAGLGLSARSVPFYEKAEELFGEAYCVQWRLAERLHELGRVEEAEKHYAIAFERMPEQFGQVASFCFGCEGAFESAPSRNAAERVLTRLAGKEPVRPQVYYLMGLLREAQKRPAEAVACFRKAVELDPEYFDALDRLYTLSGEVFMTTDERDAIISKIMVLDPLSLHNYGCVWELHDFELLWKNMEYARELRGNQEKDVFPLKASQAALSEQRAKLERLTKEGMGDFGGRRHDWLSEGVDEQTTFSGLLKRHSLTGPSLQLLEGD